jgi:hypothetical protein
MEGMQSLRGDELVHWIDCFNLQFCPQKLIPFIFVQLWSCFLKRKKPDYGIYFSVRKISNLRLFNKCRYNTLFTLDTVTEVLKKIKRKMKDEHIIAVS